MAILRAAPKKGDARQINPKCRRGIRGERSASNIRRGSEMLGPKTAIESQKTVGQRAGSCRRHAPAAVHENFDEADDETSDAEHRIQNTIAGMPKGAKARAGADDNKLCKTAQLDLQRGAPSRSEFAAATYYISLSCCPTTLMLRQSHLTHLVNMSVARSHDKLKCSGHLWKLRLA